LTEVTAKQVALRKTPGETLKRRLCSAEKEAMSKQLAEKERRQEGANAGDEGNNQGRQRSRAPEMTIS